MVQDSTHSTQNTQSTSTPNAAQSTSHEEKQLWVERDGTRTCTGYSSEGVSVKIAGSETPGYFTPGDLLKLALAGCAALSSDVTLSHQLGDDFKLRINITGDYNEEENKFDSFTEEFVIDFSAVDQKTVQRLHRTVDAAIKHNCTIARTLHAGATSEVILPE